MKIQVLKTTATRLVGRGGLLAKKYSPEILLGAGIVGVVTSTVMACKATTKADAILEEAKDKLATIRTVHATEKEDKYSEKDFRKDLTIVYTQTGVNFVKLYGPAITLGIASVGCILGAHGIMRRRNIALMAAYNTIEKSFSDYRRRVVEELGEEKDRQFKYGIKKEKITSVETDEKGNTKKVTKEIDVIGGISQYARFFDEKSKEYSSEPEYNLHYLKCQQNYANDVLKSRGHVFLNEVYDMLGIPHSTEGAVVGWVLGNGDDYIDFGIYDGNVEDFANDYDNETIGEKRRDFVNGYKSSILLDFNVDGVIYDKI